MTKVPQQDWRFYQARTAEADAAWIRGLTVEERFALYADLFNIAWQARQGPGDWEGLDQWRFEQKLDLRLKEVDAYRKLDDLRRERAAAKDPG